MNIQNTILIGLCLCISSLASAKEGTGGRADFQDFDLSISKNQHCINAKAIKKNPKVKCVLKGEKIAPKAVKNPKKLAPKQASPDIKKGWDLRTNKQM